MFAFRQRIAGIPHRQNLHVVSVLYQPYPSGTEQSSSCLGEFFFEILHAAEALFQQLASLSLRLAFPVALQGFKIEVMVERLGCIVEQSAIASDNNFM